VITFTITSTTNYKFTEVKFLINDVLELKGNNNLCTVVAVGGTTFYKAIFNMAP
jgi:hypothetical protein